MVEVNTYLKILSDKLSIPITDIEIEYNKILTETKELLKDLNEEQQTQRALQRLSLIYKKQLRSPAVGFEGAIIGMSDCVDMVARQRREASELFRTDPQTAIAQGITNEQGEPLDTRKEWADGRANFNFGKLLPEHNLIRNIYGIAMKTKIKDDKPKLFSLTVTGDKADKEDVSIFKPLRFMAIDRTPSELLDKMYVLNSSTFTNFTVDETLQLPKYEELIKQCSSIVNISCELSELSNYHETTKDNYNRIVITSGDVVSLNLQPTSMGSRIMILEDINKSIEDFDTKGVTCWVPLRCNIDFSEGSKVLIIGRTTQGRKKDEQGNLTEELGDVSINVFGLYALPEYKISQPEIEQIEEVI